MDGAAHISMPAYALLGGISVMDFHQQYTILSKKRVRYYLCRRQPRVR